MMIKVLSLMLLIFSTACSHAIGDAKKDTEEFVSIDWQDVLTGSEVDPNQSFINMKKYESYSFFLFPDDRWFENYQPTLQDLKDEFSDFGNAIGTKNLAVWFNKKGVPDYNRSSDFVHLFDLDVNKGPYIVYVRPKNQEEIAIHKHNIGHSIDSRIELKTFEKIIERETTDVFVIDFSECDYNSSIDMLHVLKTYLRNEDDDVDIGKLSMMKVNCKIKIWAKKSGGVVKKIFCIFKRIKLEGYGIGIEIETRDLNCLT